MHQTFVVDNATAMPYGFPMEWNDPGEIHEFEICYVCVNAEAASRNFNQLKTFEYKSVPSVVLPKPHSDNFPVPKRRSPMTAKINTCDDVLPDSPSIQGRTPSQINPSVFSGGNVVRKPILLDE